MLTCFFLAHSGVARVGHRGTGPPFFEVDTNKFNKLCFAGIDRLFDPLNFPLAAPLLALGPCPSLLVFIPVQNACIATTKQCYLVAIYRAAYVMLVCCFNELLLNI